ncbi:MAG TPA: ribosome maturation factor, partial [Sphingomonas sp.]|nr:ribosome maturation factor [Sphingomonas sp.]
EARLNLVEPTEDGRKQLTGILKGVEGEQVTIDVRKYREVTVPFGAIADAKLLMTDALIAATVPLSIEGAEEFENEEQD